MVSLLAAKYARAFQHVYATRLTSNDIDAMQKTIALLAHKKDALSYLKIIPGSLTSIVDALKNFLAVQNLSVLNGMVDLLASHKRLALLVDIMKALCELYNDEHNKIVFTIISAEELTQKHKKDIHSFLEHHFHKNVTLNYRIDKKLIAGIRIESQDFLWEYSVEAHLRNIGQSLGVMYRGN